MRTANNMADPLGAFFRRKSVLPRLILINAAVFLAIHLLDLFLWLFQLPQPAATGGVSILAYYLSVPADPATLLLRPWGLFTYMFVHEDFFHFLFNMVTLYFGGQIFLMMLDEKKLLSTYLLGGLSGAAFFILSYKLFPVFETSLDRALAIGASASVLAVLIAAATRAPNFELSLILLGRVKLKYVAIAFVLIDILSISRNNPGGHIAHLGGAAWGFLYIRYLLDKSWKAWPGFFPRKRKKIKKVFYTTRNATRNLSDEDYKGLRNEQQEIIDKILEKISKKGYEGLSRDEKEILFKSGRK